MVILLIYPFSNNYIKRTLDSVVVVKSYHTKLSNRDSSISSRRNNKRELIIFQNKYIKTDLFDRINSHRHKRRQDREVVLRKFI